MERLMEAKVPTRMGLWNNQKNNQFFCNVLCILVSMYIHLKTLRVEILLRQLHIIHIGEFFKQNS